MTKEVLEVGGDEMTAKNNCFRLKIELKKTNEINDNGL